MQKLTLLPFALAAGAFAQSAPPAPAPQLTTTEQIALSTVIDKIKQIQEQNKNAYDALHQVEADISKSHPAFHFDERTNQLVPDAKPEVKPTATK